LANYVAKHKRGARLVAALNERSDLHAIKRAMFVKSAKEIGIELENTSGKLVPAKGSEIGLLERLDDRPYTTALKPGPRPAFVASSRRRICEHEPDQQRAKAFGLSIRPQQGKLVKVKLSI
jgi:hypothetical protein